MTTEEKAKRYDEAIEELRGLLEGIHEEKCEIMEEDITNIFPELKESDDEKIRKELLEHCKNQAKPYIDTGNECPQIQSWITWLEKQGEQKSTLRIDNSKAKVVFPFKAKVKSTGIVVTIHDGQLSIDGKEWIKYQSDNEDGYKVYEPEDLEHVCNVELNPTWSEEDELIIDKILCFCGDFERSFENSPLSRKIIKEDVDKIDNWLKTLKDRVQPQQGWSEEDKGNLLDVKCIIDEIWHCQYIRGELDHSCEELETLWHWLDDVWQRLEYPQDTWKPAWSEEDEHKIKDIVYFLDTAKKHYASTVELDACIDWLKSLKDRVQPKWKPSKEHIRYLQAVVNDVNNIGSESCSIALRDLLEQLKKL